MKKIILSITAIFCIYPAANADNSNAQLKLISETEQYHSTGWDQKKSLSGFGLEVYHKVSDSSRLVVNQEKRSQVDIVSDTIDKSFGFIFEARTLSDQVTYSNTPDITRAQKNVFEIGIRIDC